jgi:hypothetical protein
MARRLEFPQLLIIAALLLLVLQLGIALSEYVGYAYRAAAFPYPLDYAEGQTLDEVTRLANGQDVYRSDLSTPPYVLAKNPPLFHLVQVPFERAFGPAFWYGRAVSVISVVLAALLVAFTLWRLTTDMLASALGGVMLLSFPTILQGSGFDRVESLALVLIWAGLFIVIRWPERRSAILLSAVFFAAALYTRIGFGLTGPLTAVIWLLGGRRRKQAAQLAVFYLALSLALFVALNAATGGGFWVHIGSGLRIDFSLSNVLSNGTSLLFSAPYLALGCFIFIVMERMGDPTRSWSLVVPYLLLALLFSAFTAKAGSRVVDPYEPAAALCLGTGALVAWLKQNSWLKAGALLVIALQTGDMVALSRRDYIPFAMSKVSKAAQVEELAQMAADADGPLLADEYGGLLPLVGKPLYFQPYEFAQLSQMGAWDATALIQSIQRREFSAILLYEPSLSDEPAIVSRWEPPVRNTIWDNYQADKTTLADVFVYLPKS